jgi:hypothetical protein
VSHFAYAVIARLPGLDECAKYTLYNSRWVEADDWRVKALLECATTNTMYNYEIVISLLQQMASSIRANDHRTTVLTALKVFPSIFH